MQWIVELMSTIGIFIGAIFILVLVHELGHFLAAKFFGMRVERFMVGFPPKIFGVQKGETEYCIGATPMGGFVKISGMIDESMDTEHLQKEPEEWEYRSKPVWQRMIVISAGVIFNMILAVAIFAGIALTWGEGRIPIDSTEGIYVAESSLAHDVGFQTGDKPVAVNGERVQYFNDLFTPRHLTSSELNYTVLRNGQEQVITMPDSLLDQINERGFIGVQDLLLPGKIGSVADGTPAQGADLREGDEIIAVDGDYIDYWQQLVDRIVNAEGAIQFTILRNGEQIEKEITPNENNKIGIRPAQGEDMYEIEHVRYGLFGALEQGVNKSEETTTGIIQGFGKMFSGDISVRENLGGPVAIANITKEQTEQNGWLGFWNITAFLSVTLAIMNILPIPALDGGHLMFLLYEGITRREPSEKVRMAMQQVGFLILIGLIILVTFNDILRLF